MKLTNNQKIVLAIVIAYIVYTNFLKKNEGYNHRDAFCANIKEAEKCNNQTGQCYWSWFSCKAF